MPKNEADPQDPMEFVGVELPVASDENLEDMVLTFAEEFIRSGRTEEELLAIFRNPFYRGPYMAWQAKGDDFVKQIIHKATYMWRPTGRKTS